MEENAFELEKIIGLNVLLNALLLLILSNINYQSGYKFHICILYLSNCQNNFDIYAQKGLF